MSRAAYLSATENKFIIVDLRGANEEQVYQSYFGSMPKSEIVQKLTKGRFGIVADGMVFLKNPRGAGTLSWEFFNCDGSVANLCGNALRSVGKFVLFNNNVKEIFLETAIGIVKVFSDDQGVLTAEMPEVHGALERKKFYYRGQSVYATYVNVGVPHLVLEREEGLQLDFLGHLSQFLRNHPELGGDGANVTYYKMINDKSIDALTFERGVEDFTRACGTGAVASAIVFRKGEKIRVPVYVNMPGGILTVQQRSDNNKFLLSGDVQYFYDLDFTRFIKS